MFRLPWILGCCIGLVSLVSQEPADRPMGASQEGRALVLELGCGACHAGEPGPDVIRARAPILGAGIRPLPAEYVFEYLRDPQRVRPDIGLSRMPTFDLSDEERGALALFLSGLDGVLADEPTLQESITRLGPDGRRQGEALFDALNCAGCHEHEGVEGRASANDLGRLGSRVHEGWLRDYLLDPKTIRPTGDPPGSGSRMPSFRLTDVEADVLVDFLTVDGPEAPDPPQFDPPPPTPFAASKAETLLRHELPCLGCHRLGGDGGMVGPPLDGVGKRLKPGAIPAMIADPETAMPGTIMPRSLLREDRVDLLSAFLVHEGSAWSGSERIPPSDLPSAAAREEPAAEGEAPIQAADGETLYDHFCAHCHGVNGGGDGYNARFLPVSPTAHADSAAMSMRPDDTLFDGIYAGGRMLDRSHRMPAFGETLSREEIRSLVSYIRTLCRCRGPAWTRDSGD